MSAKKQVWFWAASVRGWEAVVGESATALGTTVVVHEDLGGVVLNQLIPKVRKCYDVSAPTVGFCFPGGPFRTKKEAVLNARKIARRNGGSGWLVVAKAAARRSMRKYTISPRPRKQAGPERVAA